MKELFADQKQQVQEMIKRVLRAIIYCRVSTDKQEQDGESLEYQEEKCRQYAALHGIEVILVLKEAKSGFIHYSLREKLTLARQMIRDGMADMIIVWDLRRFSRNFVHSAMIFEEIESVGAQIVSVSENIDNSLTGKLIRSILAWSAESEREKIVEYANRHWQTRLEHNLPVATGRPPYGWQWKNEEKTHYVLHKENAAIRLSIFVMFVNEDMSLRGIANKLTGDGIAPPAIDRKKEEEIAVWRPSTIRKLLTDPENIGILRIIKTTSEINSEGKKVRKQNPNMKTIPGGIPEIVTADMYEMAQFKLKNNRIDKSHLHSNPEDFLLKGHVYCATCGWRMPGRYVNIGKDNCPHPYYRCVNFSSNYNACPELPQIRTGKIDQLVWENCCRVFEDIDLIREAIEENIRNAINNMLEDTTGKGLMDQLREEISFAKQERSKFPEGSYYHTLISGDIREKEARLARYEEEYNNSINLIKLSNIYQKSTLSFLNFLTSMRDRYHEATFAQKRNALDVLGVRVSVHPYVNSGDRPTMIDTDQEWLTVKGAAKLSGIPARTLRVNIERGKLATHVRNISVTVIHRDEIARYLKQHKPDSIELPTGEWFTINKLVVFKIISHGIIERAISRGEVRTHTHEIPRPFIHRDELNRFLKESPVRSRSEIENIEPRVEVQYSPIFTSVQSSADGSYGNRATATEMGLPTFLKFQRRQRVMQAMLRTILDRVLQEAAKAQRLPQHVDTSYDILFPEIDVADHQTLASATQTLVSALTVARQQGWVSDETAMRLLFQFAGEELDIHDEQVRIQKQAKE